MQRTEALERDDEGQGKRTQTKGDRRARKEHDQRDDEYDSALRCRAHARRSLAMPKGGSRPETNRKSSTRYCSVRIPKPIGIDA